MEQDTKTADATAPPATLEELEAQIKELKGKVSAHVDETSNKLSMIVFSGELDKVLAAFIIATGAVAMGMDVIMFFTFWATPSLRDAKKKVKHNGIMAKMFGWMLPKGAKKLKLSQMNMGGMGTIMMKGLMKKKNIASLPEMIEMAEELGVKIFICEMSMDLMGFKREEMIDYKDLQYCGVATFLAEAMGSKVQLFL